MDQISAFFLSNGSLGVICLGLLYAVRTLFKMYSEAQESRIKEARESQAVVQQMTAVIGSLRDALGERRGH